jgi:hypothetical protein
MSKHNVQSEKVEFLTSRITFKYEVVSSEKKNVASKDGIVGVVVSTRIDSPN